MAIDNGMTICEFLRRVDGSTIKHLAEASSHVPEHVVRNIEQGKIVNDEYMRDVAIALGWLGSPRDLVCSIQRKDGGIAIVRR